MLAARTPAPPSRRRGVTLLIVTVLLALFAVIGLAFMLYSESAASSARIWREAQNKGEIKPEELLSFALGQFVYDVDPNNPNTPASPTDDRPTLGRRN